MDEGRLLELIQEDIRRTTGELAGELECSSTTIAGHCVALGRHEDMAHEYRMLLAVTSYRCAEMHANRFSFQRRKCSVSIRTVKESFTGSCNSRTLLSLAMSTVSN